MIDELKNSKGEQLFLFTKVDTNDIKPMVRIVTWDRCMKFLTCFTREQNDDRFYCHAIHQEVISKDSASASCLCNRKGWGSDFFRYITIEKAYAD